MHSDQISPQSAFSEIMMKIGIKNQNVFAITNDSERIAKMSLFNKYCHERSINVGTSYNDAIGISAGLAIQKKIPFFINQAIFSTEKDIEQIKNVICRQNLNVKIIGLNAGIWNGKEGAEMQSTEDMGIMRTLPNIKIFNVSDEEECKKIFENALINFGPIYIRLHNIPMPKINDEGYEFQEGKGKILKEGNSGTIITTGSMVKNCLEAVELLKNDEMEIELINMPSIKPIDKNLIIESAKKTKKIITVEDHNIIGGLGSAVSEITSEEFPCFVHKIGINDHFGESGESEELYEKYGLNVKGICEKIKKYLL